jgi:gliding motility-associated lipoprotein GldD
MTKGVKLLIAFFFTIIISGCEEEYFPKPFGFFRIDLPNADYNDFNSNCSFKLPYNSSSVIIKKPKRNCWIDIYYPKYNAKLYISYFSVQDDIEKYLEDSRSLAYKHAVKAYEIDEKMISNDSAKVYGTIYQLSGEVASNCQFHVTDSTTHFIRGSMYYEMKANHDSLIPITQYIQRDILYMVENIRWE